MNRVDVYKTWNPKENQWSKWAKPVIFINIHKRANQIAFESLALEDIYNHEAIYFIDLPGEKSVNYGLELAKVGFQPVTLYNGVMASTNTLVPMDDLQNAVMEGASILKEIKISPNANPAFLLDNRRLGDGVHRKPGYYDNRWSIFKQDVPTGDYLKEKGIKRIFVYQDNLKIDLRYILYSYQKAGIAIYDGFTRKLMIITKAGKMSEISHRVKVIFKLKRHAAGGFGGYIPDVYTSTYHHTSSNKSSGYRRYYGMG